MVSVSMGLCIVGSLLLMHLTYKQYFNVVVGLCGDDLTASYAVGQLNPH